MQPDVRFGAAVAISAVLHMVASAGVTTGSAGRQAAARIDSGAVPLSARLLPIASPPSPPVEQPSLPQPEQMRARERAVPVPVPRERLARAAPVPTPKAPEPVSPSAAESPRAGSPGIAHVPDPTYYAARQLDIYPTPAVLDLAAQTVAAANVKGRVLLLVLIDATGAVDGVTVIEAEPPGVFDETARRALLSARFNPAHKDGRAVKSRILIDVVY